MAGMPVPGGFQLTTTAYRSFVTDNNLQASILEHAKPELNNGRVSFESASERIHEVFEGVELSAELAAKIREAYASLGGDNPPVAVRSSTNAEDLPEMSFAGQQDTYLNVRGKEALLDLNLRLGEGTGAALAMPVVDAACRMISGMATFQEAGVSDKEAGGP